MEPIECYIVGAVRTPVGKNQGALKNWHPVDLAAKVVRELVQRTAIPPDAIDDVIFGCCEQVGAQAGNIGRNIVLASGLPESVPGTTCDRRCGSSLQAFQFAAQAIMSGTQDVVLCGGVEVMSVVPLSAGTNDGVKQNHGHPTASVGMRARYPGVEFTQLEGAEILANKYNITRDEMEQLAVESHRRAAHATENGYFQREIAAVECTDSNGNSFELCKDEGIRWPTDSSKMSQLKTLKADGRITAALASQISDGAAAMLLCSRAALDRYKLKPRARVVAFCAVGSDPVEMLGAPIPATERVLLRSGLSLEQIDLFEINEAFASVPLAWLRHFNVDPHKLNANGSAMALGHPLGCTGARLLTSLLHELERRDARYGLVSVCQRGGTANAAIIERIKA
jgi:acetyl-CoA C-acetyltransferase